MVGSLSLSVGGGWFLIAESSNSVLGFQFGVCGLSSGFRDYGSGFRVDVEGESAWCRMQDVDTWFGRP